MSKLWDKGVTLNAEIETFTVGKDPELDLVLIPYDCRASIAHARMLGRQGFLTASEATALIKELETIVKLHHQGEFLILSGQEDGHTAIEDHLVNVLGDVGKKIHTARSRNDQVLTALRLYYKDQLDLCEKRMNDLIASIGRFTEKFGQVIFPGYTHTRKAMPSSIALWGTAFMDSMTDNLVLLHAVRTLIDQSPLGTAAGFGVPLDIDREGVARELGFARVQENPIYAQLSRGKFEVTLLHLLSQILHDINRLSSDLILFSMPGLGYVELPPEFCTGSSIMPQKQNPDVLELLRAKYHIVSGYEFQVSRLTGDLLSGYNRDVQLSKEPIMRGFSVTGECLKIAALLFNNLSVNAHKCAEGMTDELFATEKVYNLVKKGIPFRDAYGQVAKSLKD